MKLKKEQKFFSASVYDELHKTIRRPSIAQLIAESKRQRNRRKSGKMERFIYANIPIERR